MLIFVTGLGGEPRTTKNSTTPSLPTNFGFLQGADVDCLIKYEGKAGEYIGKSVLHDLVK